jgi:hypothetical protein
MLAVGGVSWRFFHSEGTSRAKGTRGDASGIRHGLGLSIVGEFGDQAWPEARDLSL